MAVKKVLHTYVYLTHTFPFTIMADQALIQERYAPDQVCLPTSMCVWVVSGIADGEKFRVLVVCIFLNRTRGEIAEPHIAAFFEQYPTIESVRDADPRKLLQHYFQPLGMHRRAWWVVALAKAFLEDPPRPMVLRCKTGEFESHLSEVAHLPGVGEYASDAWRLFCREAFYASAGIRIAEQWRNLRPSDRVLLRYVQRRRQEAAANQVASPSDTLTSQLNALQISHSPPSPLEGGIVIGDGESKLFVSRRVRRQARSMETPSS